MLSVGVSVRTSLIRLPARGLCTAVIQKKSPAPGHTWSAPESAAVFLHRSPVWTQSIVRTLSGGPDPGVSGWYSDLADSAPVHLCEHLLVSVQQVSGLPWWLSIAVTTLSVRTLITLPLAAYQLVIISKVEVLQKEISELAKRLRYEVSVRARDRGWTERESRFQFQKNLRRLVSQLYVRDNCHPFKASLLVWVQLPLWVSLSLALRNLSMEQTALHGDLVTGGTLWFPDLTLPDSTWILPVCVGFTNLLIVEMFSLHRLNPTRFQRLVLNLIRGFSVLMVPIAAAVPSSMVLYWFTSSLVGLGHNLLLRSATVHKILQLRSHRSETPFKDLLSAFVSKYCKIK
ncbi:cytochrome c oxidase assembly protein COX18, mitochondrial isoform X1 [Anabas testudineus]|uniref:Membrane insertase YidC/Oxa/ALB C-terminal domain-containing protein n=1 Tax=Anabas testudineus TaxID=64144 RepID=A0A3Q1JCW7_ANATE|nr:cytochrome c oxidase assembly protein COX18, mitochondrial isoform X1 [Anabas testudineus]XP_026199316.1 cytochrome c oxidase assembly protein COX18, mitochondrial isoform X1 [Anabas testudineus]